MQTQTITRATTIFRQLAVELYGEDQYTTDYLGRRVYVEPSEWSLRKEERRRQFLVESVRAFEEEDALETVGAKTLAYWKAQKYVVADRMSEGRYLITAKGAAAYKLPQPMVCGARVKFLA